MSQTTKQGKPSNRYAEAWAGFCRETAEHKLTVLHSDGLYRHLRMAAPGTRMWSWDVTTWPGHLATSGDIADGFMFNRLPDMLDFFHVPKHLRNYYSDGSPSIDFRYWAEKLTGGRSNEVQQYSSAMFLAHVSDTLAEHDELGDEAQEEYDNIITATKSVCAARGVDFQEYLAKRRAVGDSRHTLLELDDTDRDYDFQRLYYGLEIPELSPAERRSELLDDARYHAESEHEARQWLDENRQYLGEDTWEWNLRDWDMHFLFACYCIDMTVQAYRELEAADQAPDQNQEGTPTT